MSRFLPATDRFDSGTGHPVPETGGLVSDKKDTRFGLKVQQVET